MPAILSQILDPRHLDSMDTNMLAPRQHTPETRRKVLSPTAIGFIVALFTIFVIGPFLCMIGMRRHRAGLPSRTLGPATRQLRREDARRRLGTVTEVASAKTDAGAKHTATDEKGGEDGKSTYAEEQECAICLSALHAPLPPEAAKLATTGTSSVIPPSIPGGLITPPVPDGISAEQDEILRLKVCGHEFHAECLLSWFLVWKYSCPICRAVYYSLEADLNGNDQPHEGAEGASQQQEDNTNRPRQEV